MQLSSNVFLDMQRIAAALSGSAAEAVFSELERSVVRQVEKQLHSGQVLPPTAAAKWDMGVVELAVSLVAAMAPVKFDSRSSRRLTTRSGSLPVDAFVTWQAGACK